jgi:hypothetical protein
MNLKEFIKETISAIVDATSELQNDFELQDVLINPPTAQSGSEVFQVGSGNYTMRRVQSIEFDVAVTAATETGASGKAGIKVLSMGIGGSVDHASSSEQVSRVKFKIPLTLKPSKHENLNLEAQREARNKTTVQPAPSPSLGANRKF